MPSLTSEKFDQILITSVQSWWHHRTLYSGALSKVRENHLHWLGRTHFFLIKRINCFVFLTLSPKRLAVGLCCRVNSPNPAATRVDFAKQSFSTWASLGKAAVSPD